MPQKSHSEVETSPTDAESSAPRRPTMAASIYCIMILDNWAIMAGHDSLAVSLSCCPKVRWVEWLMSELAIRNA